MKHWLNWASYLVTVNPLPLPRVTFPTPTTDRHQPHARIPKQVIYRRLQDRHASFTAKNLMLRCRDGPVLYCELCPWKTERGRERDIRAVGDNRRTAAETKTSSVTAEGSASFECVALLSTCTKASEPWELIFLDTRPLILRPRPCRCNNPHTSIIDTRASIFSGDGEGRKSFVTLLHLMSDYNMRTVA